VNKTRQVTEQIAGKPKTQPAQPELQPQSSGCHKVGASGCYTMAVTLAIVTMFALWRFQFHPSELLVKFICLTISSISGVVFMWLLFVKKW